MKYYEGIDYWVRYVEFPNMASPSLAASNGDGTFNIYINTLFCPEKQGAALEHELKHLSDEHFYRDDLTISQVERSAEGLGKPLLRPLPGNNPQYLVFRPDDAPKDVTFAFLVPDDSMRPYIKKGSIAYCDQNDLIPGDVGLFNYKGNTMCRQYHRDIFGITYLFSVNRKKESSDIIVPRSLESGLRCYGRVRMNKGIPLPGI